MVVQLVREGFNDLRDGCWNLILHITHTNRESVGALVEMRHRCTNIVTIRRMNRQEVLRIAEGMGDFALHFWYDVVGDFAPQFWHDGMGDLARFWYSSRRSRHFHGLKALCLKNCFLIWTPPVFWAEDGREVVHEHGRRMLKRTWLLERWL